MTHSLTQVGPDMLPDEDLDAVSGGLVMIAIIAILIAPVLPAVQDSKGHIKP
jgi:hypothetical protein